MYNRNQLNVERWQMDPREGRTKGKLQGTIHSRRWLGMLNEYTGLQRMCEEMSQLPRKLEEVWQPKQGFMSIKLI